MLVLVVVFGTLVAAGVPLATCDRRDRHRDGHHDLVGHIYELSVFVFNMMIMIGLAVGIDYTLFIVGRYREERARGCDSSASIIRTGDTASKAVLFSGLTVVTALLGMLIVPSHAVQEPRCRRDLRRRRRRRGDADGIARSAVADRRWDRAWPWSHT